MDKKILIKKLLPIFLLFIVIGIVITCSILIIINDVINKVNNSSAINSISVSKVNYEYDINESLNVININSNSNHHKISYDNKYIVYLKDNYLEIMNIDNSENNIIYEEVKSENEIIYFTLDDRSNNVIYVTKYEDNMFNINVYNIDDKSSKEYNKIRIDNFSKVKQLVPNLRENVIYINFETKTLTSINNLLYKIELNSFKMITDKLIDNMTLVNEKDIYYIDNINNIYLNDNKLALSEDIIEIIGVDKENNIYFLTNSKVYKVKNDIITETIMLTDSDLVSYYNNDGKVYLIYPTYIIEITSKNKYERIYKLTNDVSFISIINDTIYLKSKNGNIMWKKIV